MTENSEDNSSLSGGEPKQPATWRVFATARQEMLFAWDHGLLAQSQTAAGPIAIQIVMHEERAAREIAALIQVQHKKLNNVIVRRSPSQGNRWVVQFPVWQAHVAGLLPSGLTPRNVTSLLGRGISGDPLACLSQRDEWEQQHPLPQRSWWPWWRSEPGSGPGRGSP